MNNNYYNSNNPTYFSEIVTLNSSNELINSSTKFKATISGHHLWPQFVVISFHSFTQTSPIQFCTDLNFV